MSRFRLFDLNPEQERAVRTTEGPLLFWRGGDGKDARDHGARGVSRGEWRGAGAHSGGHFYQQGGDGFHGGDFTFSKYGHMGVYIESRRGGAAAPWEFLAIDTESPYVDARPLLVAAQPELREYRMRFWDKGTPNGDWTDVAKETAGV